MQYEQLRHFADSWGLVFMTVVMIAVVAWVFRPGSRKHHDDASMIPLREDEDGAADKEVHRKEGGEEGEEDRE